MAGDPTRLVVPQMARLWLAPVGTTAPNGPTPAMPAGWFDVGLFVPGTLDFATNPSFEDIKAHQSSYPVRTIQTEEAATFKVELMEWSDDNFIGVHGGGSVILVTPTGGTPPPPYYKFTPPAIGGRSETAACLEIIDGANYWRRIVPRSMQREGVDLAFDRTKETTLPLSMTVLGSDVGAPWYDMTNLTAFNPA